MNHGGIFGTPLFWVPLRDEDLPECLSSNLSELLNRVTLILDQFKPAELEHIVGKRQSPIRNGIHDLASNKEIWRDLVNDEVIRMTRAVHELRSSIERTHDQLPERLLQLRHAAQFGTNEAAEKAINELLEQPAGQRDPFIWILRGWLCLERQDPEAAKSAFVQAYLRSEGVLHAEASRLIADIECENNDPESAYQTLRRVDDTDPTVKFDLLRYAILTGRKSEVKEIIELLVPGWPLSILGLFSDPSILAQAPIWRPALDGTVAALIVDAREESLQWARSLHEAAECLRQVDPSLILPAKLLAHAEKARTLAEGTDAFTAAWVLGEARRGMANVAGTARSTLRGWVRAAHTESLHVQDQLELQLGSRREEIDCVRTQTVPYDPSDQREFGFATISWSAAALSGCLFLAGRPWWAASFIALVTISICGARMYRTRQDGQRALLRERQQQEDVAQRIADIEASFALESAALTERATELHKSLQRADATMRLLENWPHDFRKVA